MKCKRKRNEDALRALRQTLQQEVRDLNLYHKILHAVELLSKAEQQNNTILRRGELALFGLESTLEEQDEMNLIFRQMWEKDVRAAFMLTHHQKACQNLEDKVIDGCTWTREELVDLRTYLIRVREVEQRFVLNCLNQKQPKFENKAEQDVQDVDMREWSASSNCRNFEGFFHIYGIANEILNATWFQLVQFCKQSQMNVNLHFENHKQDATQEIYVDLPFSDFFVIGTTIAKQLNYMGYMQYYFLCDPTTAIAHTSQFFTRVWPDRNGSCKHKQSFFLAEDANVIEKLQCDTIAFANVSLHYEISLTSDVERCYVHCSLKQFEKLVKT